MTEQAEAKAAIISINLNRQEDDFAEQLLAWYAAHKRDLPWRRRQDDAYAVWISEIMLQQTTVNAVAGFYERWMERFPTIEHVADASVDDVLRHWAGLGYYPRARNIKRTADLVTKEKHGRMPELVHELVLLPGIGRYTAGAISSIAYNHDSAILDANVTRVLCRLAAIESDPKSAANQAKLWKMAVDIIPAGRARDFNQALMELGALVCTPRAPACAACPTSQFCNAFKLGQPDHYPAATAPKQWKSATHVAVFILRGEKLLLVKRPENTVWAGLWELPRVVAKDRETIEDAAMRAAEEIAGIQATAGLPFAIINHVVMDTKIKLIGFVASVNPSTPAIALGCADTAWICPEQLSDYAISSPQRRLLSAWLRSRAQSALPL